MMRPLLTTLSIGAVCVALGCTNSELTAPLTVGRASFAAVPADGNGNKTITTIDAFIPAWLTCPNGTILDLKFVGWLQNDPFVNPVSTYHIDFIYQNAAGQAVYVWHQVGAGMVSQDENGNLLLTTIGRNGYLPNTGRFTVNLTTGEVTVIRGAGISADANACAAVA